MQSEKEEKEKKYATIAAQRNRQTWSLCKTTELILAARVLVTPLNVSVTQLEVTLNMSETVSETET